jgi:hypothetical protein
MRTTTLALATVSCGGLWFAATKPADPIAFEDIAGRAGIEDITARAGLRGTVRVDCRRLVRL